MTLSLKLAGYPWDHVALTGVQRLPHVAAPLRPPDIVYVRAEFFRHDLDDLVLKPLLTRIGEGKIIGVGTNSKVTSQTGRTGGEQQEAEQR